MKVTEIATTKGLTKIEVKPIVGKDVVLLKVTVKGVGGLPRQVHTIELTSMEARLAAKRIQTENTIDLRKDAYKIKGGN
jgi:hypothetical protein